MHFTLKYTYEGECNSSITFLGVLVTKSPSSYLTSVYCKSIFTGLHTVYTLGFILHQTRKINLIWTRTHHALMICSKSKLDEEFKIITDTLSKNGYPLDVIGSVIQRKITEFS